MRAESLPVFDQVALVVLAVAVPDPELPVVLGEDHAVAVGNLGRLCESRAGETKSILSHLLRT